jgi:hypothetical protein
MSLKQFMKEFGITTYDGVVSTCARLGVMPPQRDTLDVSPVPTENNPTEGVVVIQASTVEDTQPEESQSDPTDVFAVTGSFSTKRTRKKITITQ